MGVLFPWFGPIIGKSHRKSIKSYSDDDLYPMMKYFYPDQMPSSKIPLKKFTILSISNICGLKPQYQKLLSWIIDQNPLKNSIYNIHLGTYRPYVANC